MLRTTNDHAAVRPMLSVLFAHKLEFCTKHIEGIAQFENHKDQHVQCVTDLTCLE